MPTTAAETLVERIDQFVALAGAVAQVMRLVDDHEVETAACEPRRMFAPACERDGSDQPLLLPESIRIGAQEIVVSRGTRKIELRLKLFPPLAHKRSRCEHQNVLDHAAQHIFLKHHAGLDRLAEPDFVGEQHPAAELFEDLAYGLNLVPEGLDAVQVRQAEKLVEALRKAEMCEPLPQRYQPPFGSGAFCRAVPSGARSISAPNGISISISGSP